jgi:hypothetical protein
MSAWIFNSKWRNRVNIGSKLINYVRKLINNALIIHDPKSKNVVNIESKTENRVDIGSKLVNNVPKHVNSTIIYVKKTRFATIFDHRKIAIS